MKSSHASRAYKVADYKHEYEEENFLRCSLICETFGTFFRIIYTQAQVQSMGKPIVLRARSKLRQVLCFMVK